MIRHYLQLLWKRRSRHAFLFIELLLTFFILTAVFQYSFDKLKSYNEPLGFKVADRFLVYTSFNEDMEVDSITFFNRIAQLKKSLSQLPEIEGIGLSTQVTPYGYSQWTANAESDDFKFSADYLIADEGIAEAYDLEIISGRFYTKDDYIKSKVPVVVNQLFVDKHLKGKDPLGFEFMYRNKPTQIVGVVKAFKYFGEFMDESPFLFYPAVQHWSSLDLLAISVKPNTPATIQKQIHDVLRRELKHDDFSITPLASQKRSYNSKFWVPLLGMLSVSLFLVINIAMGLFGTLRYAVNKRRSEIGLRKVMGATAANIRLQIVGEMLLLTALAFIVALIPILQLFWFGNFNIKTDTFVKALGSSFVIITLLVWLCSLLPSQSAAKLAPAVALHQE